MILIQPSIDPVIFSFGILDIRWYSLAYILGFVIGSFLLKKYNESYANILSNKEIDNFFIWAILGVIIGGRIGYVLFYQTNYFFINPFYILEIWKGGMSFHGGLIGIIVSTYLFCKKTKINFLYLSDLVSIVAPVGLFFGRIGNFINTELYGRVTTFPFAMIFPSIDNQPRHPSQLYEALFEGLILFIILLFYFKIYKNKKKYGKISGIFLVLYSIFRFLIEFLREPDPQIGLMINIFSMGQILCIPIFVFGIIIIRK